MCTYSWRVPPTAAGQITIATSWNLGGLGATQGPPVTCHCAAPNLMPVLLPWLVILALLALKPNRCWAAWWIWLPLACLAAGTHCLQPGWQTSRSGVPREIFDLPGALAFGLAATWLLAPYLARSRRFRTLLCLLPTLVSFSVFSFAALANWDGDAGETASKLLALLALVALVVAAAMVFCGWICRGRYRPIRLCAGLLVSLLVVYFAMLAAFSAGGMFASHGGVGLSKGLICGLLMAAASFVVLLTFMVLSFASTFFRKRLKALFHLERQGPPPRVTADPKPASGVLERG